MKQEARLSRTEWLLIAALAALALAARLVPGERTVDDAYITFRYARNLVEGHGFVYNPSPTGLRQAQPDGPGQGGERVLGTTTPLYTLLLAGLSLASGSRDLPALALGTNTLAGAASVVLLYFLGKHVTGQRGLAAAAALLWAVAPFSVTFAVGGMETDLTIALLLAAAYAHVTNRPRALAVLSALALLTRPDTAILLGLLWLDLFLARRRIPWREGLITLGLLAPWLIFGTLYFGNPLTVSVAAKSIAYRLPPTADLVRMIQHYSTPFFENVVLGPKWQFIGFAVYLLLCGLGGLRSIRQNCRAWPLLAYPYLYLAVLAAANPLLFRWYFSPPLPFYFLFILAGIWAIANDLAAAVSRLKPIPRPTTQPHSHPAARLPTLLTVTFAALALASTIHAWVLHPDHGPDRPAPEMAWFQLELLYARAADVVLAHAMPDDTLCAGDIGMLGYRTNMHILDTVGLVTPESTRHYPADPAIYAINYAIPADLVLALDPDTIVILEVYGRLELLPDPRFQARYRLLEKIETDIYGSDGMLIFERTPQ